MQTDKPLIDKDVDDEIIKYLMSDRLYHQHHHPNSLLPPSVIHYLTLILNCYSSEPELHILLVLNRSQAHYFNQPPIKSIWKKIHLY